MIPVLVKDIFPNAALQKYVRKYQVFRFVFDKNIIPPFKRHYPRPEHCITFYIKDVQKFQYRSPDIIRSYPNCVINGMHTTPVYRYGGNDFLAIKIILRPSVLHKLLKFPIYELTNSFINAEDIWGKEVSTVCDCLKELDKLSGMVTIVENFVESQIKKIKTDYQPIDKVSDWLIDEENNVPIGWLANQSCLSTRQFIRKFEERIGVSAKTFERIIRFDKAYRMKNRHPEYDWLLIAVSCNYHDYQHMVKDFKEFSNLTPCSLYELELDAPERSFGFSYLT
ncbi:helix-turn-helix domain-containing protein [Agriterribacter sp.]|uniref:helix-turn-helix domain-containing protein n=1 Tax=Agriterribacter sp. TaxID=2821509 RepID=UPI002CF8285E|nr:helix-turn-helix domain-containing protein [Agriterribacter sp.]HRP57466.1 helix-turn-helix domain-containing protein [Agriterribacter sp.]